MKNFTSILILFFISAAVHAQDYTLSAEQSTYSYLDEGTILIGEGEDWDDPILDINIGFDFIFHGDTFNQVFISDDISFDVDGNDYVDAVYLDFVDRNEASRISTQLVDDNGFKVFKIEWRNVAMYQEEEDLGTTDDSLNVQVWLHEGTNDISIHMGPHSIPEDLFDWDTGAYIGIWKEDIEIQKEYYYYAAGNPATPDLVYSEIAVSGLPDIGYVYTFEYNPPFISTLSFSLEPEVNIFPNPANNFIHIGLNCESIQIIDLIGKIVFAKSNIQAKDKINVSALSSGMYLLNGKTPDGKFFAKKLTIH